MEGITPLPKEVSFAAALSILDDMAKQYQHDPRVIGFRVFGAKEDYEAAWNAESRSPLRWRSGEWQLFSGNDGFDPVFREVPMPVHEPLVKFYKCFEKGGNGAFALSTTAETPEDFLQACAHELGSVLERLEGDWEFTFDAVLPQICQVWAKLRGYKADDVHERRMLVIGEPLPDSSMTCLNVPDPSIPELERVS